MCGIVVKLGKSFSVYVLLLVDIVSENPASVGELLDRSYVVEYPGGNFIMCWEEPVIVEGGGVKGLSGDADLAVTLGFLLWLGLWPLFVEVPQASILGTIPQHVKLGHVIASQALL